MCFVTTTSVYYQSVQRAANVGFNAVILALLMPLGHMRFPPSLESIISVTLVIVDQARNCRSIDLIACKIYQISKQDLEIAILYVGESVFKITHKHLKNVIDVLDSFLL